MNALGGRVALVTGASRGIGAAIAAALEREGSRVVRVARTLTDGRRDGGLDVRCDLTQPDQVDALRRRVTESLGVPELVVSNAGAFVLRPLEQTDPATFDDQLAANLRAPFLVARAFLPAMREAGRGQLVQIGSVVDHRAFPQNAAYAAGKFGLRGLHETLVEEFRGSGVRLTLISPGPTDTSIWDPFDPDNRPGFPSRAAMLRPADVADAVVFVATRPPHVLIDWLRLGAA